MSREVLGSALEDVAPPTQDAVPPPGAGAVALDDKAGRRGRAGTGGTSHPAGTGGSGATRGPATAPSPPRRPASH